MKRVYPQQLAVIVPRRGAPVLCPQNVGRWVWVLRQPKAGEVFASIDGLRVRLREGMNLSHSWVVRCATPLAWEVGGRVCSFYERILHEQYLSPIRPQAQFEVDEMLLIAGRPGWKQEGRA